MARTQCFNYHSACDVDDLNRLQDDLINLGINISSVILVGGTLHVRSSLELTQVEKTLVDSTIEDFVDVDLSQKVPKIYDYVNSGIVGKHHHDIQYTTELKSGYTLIPKRTVNKGEVTNVDWYMEIDADQNPANLVLKVDIVYNRDATGFATYRTTTRTWINKDESENPDKKITPKYYFVNQVDMIAEGYKRRKLLVQSIQIPTLTHMTYALMPLGYSQQSILLQGRHFMDDYDGDFNRFVENSSTVDDPADDNFGRKNIIVSLEDNGSLGRNKDYNLWLDKAPASLGGTTTIRQYLINEFSI